MRFNLKAEVFKSGHKNQANLCRVLGWRDERLSRIITGRKDPTESEKELIADKLGLDPENEDLWLNQ